MREGGRLAQRQDEQGAASGAVGRGELRVRGIRRAQLAAEFGDDVAGDHQPQSQALGLGGVEGREQAGQRFGAQARSVVMEIELHPLALVAQGQGDAAAGLTAQSVQRVLQQIDQHLLQPDAVGQHPRILAGGRPMQRHALPRARAAGQQQRASSAAPRLIGATCVLALREKARSSPVIWPMRSVSEAMDSRFSRAVSGSWRRRNSAALSA